jgi:hypothetical protein
MRYAAGDGQTQGTVKGQLPYGYAPLPTALRSRAKQAADRLEKGVPDADESSGGTSTGGDDISGTGGGGTAAGGTDGGTTGAVGTGSTGTPGATADASGTARPSTAPTETDPAKQNVAQSGGHTPSEVLGIVRWVLLGVLVAGGAAALAGPVLLRFSTRRKAAAG